MRCFRGWFGGWIGPDGQFGGGCSGDDGSSGDDGKSGGDGYSPDDGCFGGDGWLGGEGYPETMGSPEAMGGPKDVKVSLRTERLVRLSSVDPDSGTERTQPGPDLAAPHTVCILRPT